VHRQQRRGERDKARGPRPEKLSLRRLPPGGPTGGHGLFLLRHLQEASSQPLRMAQIYPPKHHGHQPQKYTRPLPPKLQKQHVVGRVLTLQKLTMNINGIEIYDDLIEIHKQQNSRTDKYPKLRSLLERICKDLTKNESIQFSNLFSRLNYVCEKTNLDRRKTFQINTLRINANNVLHSDF